MKKSFHSSLLYLLVVILFILSIPFATSRRLQQSAIAVYAPVWETMHDFQLFISSLFGEPRVYHSQGQNFSVHEEIERLQLENHLLHRELQVLRQLGNYHDQLLVQWNELQDTSNSENTNREHFEKYLRQKQHLFKLQLEALPARVIYRAPTFWNSFMWVNVGEHDNLRLGKQVIAKNSPVVVGVSIIGVVEEVLTHQSRVRLITDSSLNPSVRALRDEQGAFQYLAKGELQGSSKSLWRSQGHVLKGTGFNYDFSDEEGAARDLYDQEDPILQIHDLLVTTGMDGVFPPGLHVGIIKSIAPLEEGDYFYELEATPTAGNMDQLSLVFILPPYSQE